MEYNNLDNKLFVQDNKPYLNQGWLSISPYIFILCIEKLSQNLKRKLENGMALSLGNVAILSRIFFTDDLFVRVPNEHHH